MGLFAVSVLCVRMQMPPYEFSALQTKYSTNQWQIWKFYKRAWYEKYVKIHQLQLGNKLTVNNLWFRYSKYQYGFFRNYLLQKRLLRIKYNQLCHTRAWCEILLNIQLLGLGNKLVMIIRRNRFSFNEKKGTGIERYITETTWIRINYHKYAVITNILQEHDMKYFEFFYWQSIDSILIATTWLNRLLKLISRRDIR